MHRLNGQWISILDLSYDRFFIKIKCQWHILHILQTNTLLIFATYQQRPKVDLTHIEKDIRLFHTTNYHEVLNYLFTRYLENPITLMNSNQIWSVLKYHLWLFTTQDCAFLGYTSKETWIWSLILVNPFPFKIISQRCWIYYVKSLSILHLCP